MSEDLNRDFTLEAWLQGAGVKMPPSVDDKSAMPVLRQDSAGWTHLEIKGSPDPVTYIHGETEIIDGVRFNVVSVYDSKTMKLRQKILTRSDLLKG